MGAQHDLAVLVHRYSDGISRRDVEQWSACWADDAVWTIKPGRVLRGRAEIVAFLEHAFSILEGVVQHVLNGEVAVTGTTATGRWHIQELFRRTTGERGLILAHYDDTYVERDGRWQFASRRLVRHYEGPPDLSGVFTPLERATS